MLVTREVGRWISAALLVISLAAVAGAQTRVTMSVGHSGAVRDTAGRRDLDLAFSVGDDGKLLVWNLVHGGLEQSYQISRSPVTRIALHPSRSEAVLYVQEGVRTGRLVGIDWETGSELFSTPIEARPQYLAYSPQGTMVVYSLASFDSLAFLGSRDGRRRNFLTEGFGVVSFVQMARSERNVMTYVPSRGEFIYWQLQSGDELQTVRTTARLEHLTLIDESTQRFLAASDGQQLVVVDNLTGETRASYPVRPIHDITYDAQSERILVLTDQVGNRSALAFTYSSGRLRRDFYRPQNLHDQTATLAAVGREETRAFLAGASIGEIASFEIRNGRRTLLGPAALTPITDLAFTDGRLHLAAGEELVSFVSDLFEGDTDAAMRLGFIRETRPDTSGFPSLAIESTRGAAGRPPESASLLLWGSTQPGTLYELQPPAGEPRPVYDDESDVPISRVSSSSSGPLVVHRDGRVAQVDAESGTERFRYTAVGTQDALWDPQIGLVVAKTRASAFDSSVIVVDQLTQETVTADTDAFLTTRLTLDPQTDTLYSIGLYGSQSAPETRLTMLTGRGFSRSTVLAERPFELSRGDLVFDEETQTLFSSMEYTVVRTYRGRREGSLERVNRLHYQLGVGSHFVVARNADGTVTFWDRQTGEHLVDLYLFGDDWVAIGLEGRFLSSSPRAERYLTLIPEPGTRLELDDFRLTPPFNWPLD